MLLRVAAFACVGGFLYGYDLGLISGALSPIREELHASEVAAEIMVGAAKFGAIFGTFLGGAFMLYYGRRLTIGLDSAFFIIGPIIMAFSAGITGLIVGRFLIGLGIGVSAVVVPAYLGEVAPATVRGRIVEMYEVMLCLGMLTAMLVDAALQHVPWNWRWMVGAPVVPALVLALALVVLPESPRWLVVNCRLDEALAVIHRVYTDSQLPLGAQESNAEVEQELMELWSSVEKDKAATRDRAQQLRQHSLEAKARAGWRHLRFRRGKWHSLESPQEQDDQQPSDAHGASADVELIHSQLSSSLKQQQDRQSLQCSSEDLPPDGPFSREQPDLKQADTSNQHSLAEHRRDTNQKDEDINMQDRQVSGSLAGTSERGNPGLRITVVPVAAGGGSLQELGGSRGGVPVDQALRDPTSPLYRSLSEIPTGLPPVRTKSMSSDSLDCTPDSALHAPRKGSLRRRLSRSKKFLDVPKSSAIGSSFWRVSWEMMTDIKAVATGPEQPALYIALWLAFFNQAMASSAIINYAPQLLEESGVHDTTAATLLTSTVTAAKITGVFVGVALIDSAGRRPLLIWGSAGCCGAMLLLFGGVFMHSVSFEIVSMCVFMLAFNSSYAGVFWVLLSELFSMSSKSPAASAATAMLFIAGFLADSLFLTLLDWCGAYTFLLFAGIAGAGGVYSWVKVPETKGRTLAEVQELITGKCLDRQQDVSAPIQPIGPAGPDAQGSPSQAGALLAAEEGKEFQDEEHQLASQTGQQRKGGVAVLLKARGDWTSTQ